jgi:hypothetical protein
LLELARVNLDDRWVVIVSPDVTAEGVKWTRTTADDLVGRGRRVVHSEVRCGRLLAGVESVFYLRYMSSLASDFLFVTQTAGAAASPVPRRRLTSDEGAATVAELKQAATGWAALLAECAGLVLGYGGHQFDDVRYRQIAELCIAAGVDETQVEAWIEVGRERASIAAGTAHKACVLWDS